MDLTDIPRVLGHELAHKLGRLLGLDAAVSMFCDHCPEVDLWAVEELAPPTPFM